MISRAIVFASCLALGCAQSIPGVDPPGDEVFFPIGITVIPDESGRPVHLAVLSSNFDQRFNSGMITTYWIGNLFALTSCAAPVAGVCLQEPPALRGAQSDTIRVFSFGGDLVYVPKPDARTGNLFVASRGRNRLTMVNVDTAAEKLLNCSTPGAEFAVGSDCTRAFAVDTKFADPFSLAHVPARSGHPDLIAVGHVAILDDGAANYGAVALADVQKFRDRPAQEAAGADTFTDPVDATQLDRIGGFSGLAYAGDIFGHTDVVLAATLRAAPDLLLDALVPEFNDATKLFRLVASGLVGAIPLGTEIGAIEMRSLAVSSDSTRAYASVRFFAPGSSYNSGIAVLDLTGDEMVVVSVLEVGDELQKPFLREVANGTETARLLYVGDIRRDKIFIVDVTTDSPLLLKEVDGRIDRTIDGETVQARLLDSPSQIAFASDGTSTFGFVTNFSNSTIAVLDVSDPDPRMHRIVARLGRNIDPEGEMEKP